MVKSDAKHVLSQRDLGKANQYRVLQALVDYGPLSRAELARILSVSRASVGVITNGLIEYGVLTEEPSAPLSGRGKPPVPLWFSKDGYVAGAISVEPTQVHVGCVNARGKILVSARESFGPDIDQPTLTELVLELASKVFSRFADEIRTAGMTVPAQCLPIKNHIERSTILPALTESDLPTRLEQTLGFEIALEQDVRALASAERWFGAGRGQSTFAVLHVDYGVGVGVVIDGSLFPGSEQSSPQFGHLPAGLEGLLCSCGNRGCWETVASIKWLESELSDHALTATEAIKDAGSKRAKEIVNQYFNHISVGLSGLAHIIHTPLIILQGAMKQIGEGPLHMLQDSLSQRSRLVAPPMLIVSALGDRAQLLGAGAVALSRELGVAL